MSLSIDNLKYAKPTFLHKHTKTGALSEIETYKDPKGSNPNADNDGNKRKGKSNLTKIMKIIGIIILCILGIFVFFILIHIFPIKVMCWICFII